jgi:hypothetical protein
MLSSNQTKLRLYVQSRKVPVGLTEFSRATPLGYWYTAQSPVRAVVYEQVLDDAQKRLVEEARQLSCNAGITLEVVDLGRMSALRRTFVSRIVGRGLTAVASGPGDTSRIPDQTKTLS